MSVTITLRMITNEEAIECLLLLEDVVVMLERFIDLK